MYYFTFEAHLTKSIVPNDLPGISNVTGMPKVEIKRSEFDHHRHTFSVSGFSSEPSAKIAARRLGDALLIHGAIRAVGIRFLNCAPAEIPEIKKATFGTIATVRAHGSLLIHEPLEYLEKGLVEWTALPHELTEQQRACVRLLNDYHFIRMWESKLVLAVSAVEALCGTTKLDDTFQFAVRELCEQLNRIELSDQVRDELKRRLRHLDQLSIRQAYLNKIRSLLTEKDAKKFDKIYNLRSKFVHTGATGAELQNAAISAHEIAVRLIKAELGRMENANTE